MAENVIYRTAEAIEEDMMAVYEAITGRQVTDLNEDSVIRTIIKMIAQEHQETDYQIAQAAFKSNLRFANGPDLDLIGADEGVTRKGTLAATGSIRLSKATSAVGDSAVAAVGSIVISNGTTRYTNTEACRIFSGATAWVVNDGVYSTTDIPFQSTTQGTGVNSATHTVTQVQTAPAEVDTADNHYPFIGGRLQETNAEYRQRIQYERDRRAGGSRVALQAEALGQADVFSAEMYEWSELPSGSKYVRPSPGEIWCYIFETFATSERFAAGVIDETYAGLTTLNPTDILMRTRNALETVRAYPISLKVFHAYVVTVNVEITVTLYRNRRIADTASASADIAQRIRAHILSLKIGEDLSLGHIYSLISDVTPYKEASVKFSVGYNRTHSWTDEDVITSVNTELDEILKPAGSFDDFGTITISYEDA